MPCSSNLFFEETKSIIKQINPKSAFDIGVGAGKYGKMIKSMGINCIVDGSEPVKQYAEQYKAEYAANYRKVNIVDFRDLIKTMEADYDLWIFGDVLEHMFYSEVFNCLDYCLSRSKYILCLIPINSKQKDAYGQLSERHISEIILRDLIKYDIIYFRKEWDDINKNYKQLVLIRGGM